MFLSIIIPIWNDEKYIRECLDSCLNQDLPPEEYEILCMDDGSTDHTPEILKEYAARHQNVHPYLLSHQGGGRRNDGLEIAKGDFVWFVDHDDFIAPHAIDTLYRITREKPGYERYNFRFYEFYDSMNEQEKNLYHIGKLDANSPMFGYKVIWTFIIRKSFLKENEITPTPRCISEAKAFWGKDDFPVFGTDALFVLECNDAGVRDINLNDCTLYYYRRTCSSSSMKRSSTQANNRLNEALVLAYIAAQWKNRYLQDRKEHGRADAGLAKEAVLRIRSAVSLLADIDMKRWKQGIRSMKEKDIFFSKAPEEYDFRFLAYWKSRSWKGKISPAQISYYFVFIKSGAFWYCLLTNYRNYLKWLIDRFKLLKFLRNRQRARSLRRGLSNSQ